MEIVGKKSQGLSVTTLTEDKTVIISFKDRSLNFYVTDSFEGFTEGDDQQQDR